MAVNKNTTVVYDVKGLIRDLEALQPGIKKVMVREAKDETKGMVRAIKGVIPATAPLSGMDPLKNPNGRLAWGAKRNAKTVTPRFRTGRSRSRAITPLISLWVTSPMTAIADVAGKGNFRRSVSMTREYDYKGGKRRHRVNSSQGRDFVANLRERDANDFVYPAVERSIPDVENKIKLVIDKYARMVNRKLG